MICAQVTVGQLGLKAVEFGPFWAQNLSDDELKIFARIGILSMGDEVTSEPVHRENGMAYVVFTPSPVKYAELGIGSGTKAILMALFNWAKANPTKTALLLASLAYVSIKVIDWQVKSIEGGVEISQDETVSKILNNQTLTADQKLAALMEYLGMKKGENWGMIAIGVAAILGAAYVLGGKK